MASPPCFVCGMDFLFIYTNSRIYLPKQCVTENNIYSKIRSTGVSVQFYHLPDCLTLTSIHLAINGSVTYLIGHSKDSWEMICRVTENKCFLEVHHVPCLEISCPLVLAHQTSWSLTSRPPLHFPSRAPSPPAIAIISDTVYHQNQELALYIFSHRVPCEPHKIVQDWQTNIA